MADPADVSAEIYTDPTDDRVSVTDSVSLHVRRWRPTGTAPPFILVHGLSSNARLWEGVAPVLAAAGHPVIAVDLRSHGESDAPDDGYDTTTAASDIAAIAAALGIKGAIVAGQSWGGNVVVQLAADHPAVVAGLALVDGGWIDPSASFPSWQACEAALRPPSIDGLTADAMRGFLRDGHPSWSPAAIEATLASVAIAPDGTVSRRLSVPHHMQIVRSMWDDPPRLHYPDIHVRVLLIPAIANDPAGAAKKRAIVQAATAALSTATIREYVGADHDIHAQHPASLAADLLELAKQVG